VNCEVVDRVRFVARLSRRRVGVPPHGRAPLVYGTPEWGVTFGRWEPERVRGYSGLPIAITRGLYCVPDPGPADSFTAAALITEDKGNLWGGGK